MHAYQPDRLNEANTSNNVFKEIFQTHPALCAGAALSVFVTAAVLTNAIWYQPGKHPAPMFTTRSIETVKPLSETAEIVIKTPAISTPASVSVNNDPELLKEVQTALSVRGYYAGKLDGVYGSRTKKAIDRFQRDHSLQANGKPSVRLLTQILLSASVKPKEVPVPKQQELVQKVSITKTAATAPKKPEAGANGLVAQIQSGLKSYGYEDLKVDGKMGQHTATAIQRFQLDYGLKITGEPSNGVLKKLKEIGAYKQG